MMGVCYLLANHTKKEYLSRGEKFCEMDSTYFKNELLFLLIYVWDLRQPQTLEWISDLDDRYRTTEKEYRDIEPDLVRDIMESQSWEIAELEKEGIR